jgi:hypothetical protein
MAAWRGLVGTACARGAATAAVLSALTSSVRAERFAPLQRSAPALNGSGGSFVLTAPFSFERPVPVLIDLGRRFRPAGEWHLRLAFQIDYLDLPLVPARGPGVFAFLGTSIQSIGGFRLHF